LERNVVDLDVLETDVVDAEVFGAGVLEADLVEADLVDADLVVEDFADGDVDAPRSAGCTLGCTPCVCGTAYDVSVVSTTAADIANASIERCIRASLPFKSVDARTCATAVPVAIASTKCWPVMG
jgi:hypothetical protein